MTKTSELLLLLLLLLVGGRGITSVFFYGYFRKKNVLRFFFADLGAKRRIFFADFFADLRPRSGRRFFLRIFLRIFAAGDFSLDFTKNHSPKLRQIVILEIQIASKMKKCNVRTRQNTLKFSGAPVGAPEQHKTINYHLHIRFFLRTFLRIFGREAADIFFYGFFCGWPAAKRPAFFLRISQNL